MRGVGKPLLDAIHGMPVAHPPFWLMRQAGRYLPEYRAIRARSPNFVELCLTPDLAAEITLQPVRRFGMDGAIIFSDILLVPYALGQELRFEPTGGPKLAPIRDAAALARLSQAIDLDILAPVYEALRLVRREMPAETTLIGFAGAPWTLATYAVGGGKDRSFAAVRDWAATDPAGFGRLIELLAEAVVAHLGQQIEAGAEVVQLFDSWAGAVTGEDDFRRWIVAPTRRIVDAVRARFPDVPIIGFPRGIGARYPDYARLSGCDVVSIDTMTDLALVRDELQSIVVVQGNLDPTLLVTGGAALEAGVREILIALGGGRLIFNLGHGVLPETPPAHVAALAEMLRAPRRLH
jgi:uroporphyrinogen decarboxylase